MIPASFCWTAALLAISLVAAVPAARATDAAPKKGNTLSLNGGKPTGRLLTRDRLRQCLAQQTALGSQGTDVAAAQAALDVEKAELARVDIELAKLQEELQAERAVVDLKDQASVGGFNARLAQRDAMVGQREQRTEVYNARLVSFNAQVQAFNDTRQAWQGACADRAYDEADFYAIQRGR